MREMKRESIALAGPDIGRDEWLMVRRQGLGGTEVAAIICDQAEPEMKVGCSVKSTYSIWAKKTGAVPEDSEVTGGVLARGHHLEGYVCHLYQQELPEGTVLFEHGLRQHPDRPIILATPDRMVDIKNTPLYGMDAKTRRFKKGWGEKGSSDVPLDVEGQMRAYMEGRLHPVRVGRHAGLPDHAEPRARRAAPRHRPGLVGQARRRRHAARHRRV